MREPLGQTLGHHRIVEKVGAGGMGVVYRARDERLDRDVAIKVLPEEVARDEERLARFEREAKLLASLSHQNIATLHGLEEHEDQQFLVMELAEGETLADWIERAPVPIDDALDYARQIAEGLEAAHERGIIHRDLKPANVMLSPEGKLKVLDFGLAKAFEPPGSEPSSPQSIADSPTMTAGMTRTGVLLGTAAYMSPEQARGKAVDKRTDVWAFGCVLYEMLTGLKAFHGNDASQVMAAILRDDPEWSELPPGTPDHIRRLLARCLVKSPRDRLHDIADARIELSSRPVDDEIRPETKASAQVRRGFWTWLPWGVAAALAVVLIVIWITGDLSDRKSYEATAIVRTTIELPPGTQLTYLATRGWKRPVRNELALSPDGRTLVFSAAAEEGYSTAALYRRPLDRTEAEMIPGTGGASGPFFSPDSRWVAFCSEGEVKKVPLDGGLPITLAKYSDAAGSSFPYMGGCWSSDDTIIIGGISIGLQRVDADGGRLESLTELDPATEYGHRMPEVLPGGRAVLFTVATGWLGFGGHIEALSLDTGKRHVVVDSGLDGRYVSTGHLLFLQQGTLMAAPFDPDQLEVTGRPVPVLEGVVHATNLRSAAANSSAGLFTVSDNGTLVYAPGGMAPDLGLRFVWMDRDGETHPVSALPEGDVYLPRVSPDGRWLAFTTLGLDSNLWVQDLTRETVTRLTADGCAGSFSWTPDGNRIVADYSQDGLLGLYLLSTQRSEPIELLTTLERRAHPDSWSPDGRFLAYVQAGNLLESFAVWLLDMNSREVEPLLPQSEHDYGFPDFSPDGRWLAYTSSESGRGEVWATSFPARERTMLISNDGGLAPLWSPDGREIYYRSEHKLMVVEVNAGPELTLGKPHTLFEVGFNSTAPLRGYDITPDGKRFIFSKFPETDPYSPPIRQLEVVLNWFEELKRLAPPD